MGQRAATVILFIALSVSLVVSIPVKRDAKPATCNACHPTVKGKINVHLVPHSHDDVGWLKTLDQYYFGSGIYNTYADAGVQYIISSAIQSLKSNPDRRYIQVETAFFWKWWENQLNSTQEDVINLLNNGQLEIINGAWSMNDEAASHYHSTIDQYTWGFRVLDDVLGECSRPKFGWQIDPFGHSREHASLLNQLGFQGLVLGRIDYRDKNNRNDYQNNDLLWQASDSLENPNMFTTFYPNSYISEGGFCFDITCQERPINDDIESPDYNLKDKVDQYASILDRYSTFYATPNVLMPMGGDFNYQAAEVNFSNMDRLIKGFKDHEKYNVVYSTPSCYVEAVNEYLVDNSQQLEVKHGDFFPYGSGTHQYWTGYFTSRPTSKRYERLGNNILQSSKQLASFAKVNGKDFDESLVPLREAMGVLQHHDAITGTEQQHVANDYARMLTNGIKKVEESLATIIGDLLKLDTVATVNLDLKSCLWANVSVCEESSKDKFLVAVQNPLSRNTTVHVRLPVNGDNYRVTGPDGEEVFDILDPISDFSYLPEDLVTSSKELVFAARDLSPLGIKLYYVERLATSSSEYKPFRKLAADDDGSFGTETTGFTIDTVSGKLTSATINGVTLELTQEYLYYVGSNGEDQQGVSGAYIFRPKHEDASSFNSGNLDVKVVQGNLVDEVHQVVNSEVTQIIRVYKDDVNPYIEFDWIVGDIQYVEQENGKEVISRFTINDFNSASTFYTDSNGREQIKRVLNQREDFQYDINDEPVSSNYYPITSRIVIKDEDQKLEAAVLNDRAQGGSSLNDGVLELMVHRRLTRDDSLGVSEALNEIEYNRGKYARGQHYLTFSKLDAEDRSPAAIERDIAQRKRLAPIVLVADATSSDLDSLEKLQNLVSLEFEGLTRSLPENVLLLTLEPWKEDTYIVRLEHTLEKGEDEVLSEPVTVTLQDLFSTFSINDIGEMTLGANQWIEDYGDEEKLIWNDIVPTRPAGLNPDNPLQITLSPMQIRTFIIKVRAK